MISFEDFKKIDLRVAEIIEVDNHPDADRLYVLKVRLGEEEKQIVAGIRASYEKEALIGKKIIIVNNLEPATLRGVESNGMLLAAKDENGLAVLTVNSDIASGSQVG